LNPCLSADKSVFALRAYHSVFPLYLYPKPEQDNLLDIDQPSKAPGGCRPNLAKEFISELSSKLRMTFIPDGKGDLKKTFGPEDVFNYMYAVFHAHQPSLQDDQQDAIIHPAAGLRATASTPRTTLGPLLAVIDQNLEDDRNTPQKQRHTAKHILFRFRQEFGFIGLSRCWDKKEIDIIYTCPLLKGFNVKLNRLRPRAISQPLQLLWGNMGAV